MSVRPIEKPCEKTGKLKKGYFVDVALTLPDGSTRRKQRRLMGVTKRDAEKVEAQLKSLLINGDSQRKEKKKKRPDRP